MVTDFFDNDLVKTDSAGHEDSDEKNGVPVQLISEASLSRMVRQKKDLSNKVTSAIHEIEFLRKKQEELEKEKVELEQITRTQEEYEHGKRDIIDKLERSVILIEKEEMQATKMAELLSETRALFKDALSELRSINEETWPEGDFQSELNKALTIIESARMDYKKALAKIDATSWHKAVLEKEHIPMLDEMTQELVEKKGFGYWLKIGFAASLPLIVVLAILFVAWLVMTGMV